MALLPFETPTSFQALLAACETYLSSHLSDHSPQECRSMARWLIEELSQISAHRWALETGLEPHSPWLNALATALPRLASQEPLQYILGKAYFYEHTWLVSPAVLIPRPETEQLVQTILDHPQALKGLQPRVLDVGTGSGCIALSLAAANPKALVSGVDISDEALAVARQNQEQLHLRNAALWQDDILSPSPNLLAQRWHTIVSNPPYIPLAEQAKMRANVREYEPHTALFVSDQNPLLFYEAISRYARQTLYEGGWLFFEIHENYAKGVVHLLQKDGFAGVEILPDLQGKARMVLAQKP
ncbi:peptide chain release factor N(5)-glutamine methyltransferase [Eisenibacter elegans]|uniref:peptide chain release factor N(5)-glutamine methyltransferase n=1 Tax=Eisenibacter elegans TaxID=997 RepID=UPI00041D33D6|nr:peptide chain release factor N(5)-glutamine methyltransferase [Eisenibacter elegans]